MWAGASRQQSEAVAQTTRRDTEGVGYRGFEPANGTRADAHEHNAGLPRLAKDGVDAMNSPDREHVRRIAATDVDHVLVEQVGAKIRNVSAEEREIRRSTVHLRECAVELDRIGFAVTTCGGQKAYARPAISRETEDEIVELRRQALIREAAPAERNDVPRRHGRLLHHAVGIIKPVEAETQ